MSAYWNLVFSAVIALPSYSMLNPVVFTLSLGRVLFK